MPRVNPEILRWARETAGFSAEEAAKKLTLLPARGASAVDRLAALESGEDFPSRPMLVRMAKQYRRPLLTFYLAAPPQPSDRGEDFRTLPEGYVPKDEPLLDALLRDIRARQGMVRAAMEDEDDIEPLPWVGSLDFTAGVTKTLAAMRETLPLDPQVYRAQKSTSEAFRELRESVEKMGVFVLLVGDLGSYHTAIDVHTFRGFALADDVAPFIVINDRDSRAAWSFSLLHELTHLLLGQTGISGLDGDSRIERFCNDVASQYLLADDEFTQIDLHPWPGNDEASDRVFAFAQQRNLSGSMVAYRLFRARIINRDNWIILLDIFRSHWIANRKAQKESARSNNGGPDFYVVRRHRIGNALINTVAQMMRSGSLTTTKAGKVLGLKPKQVQTLFDVHRLA